MAPNTLLAGGESRFGGLLSGAGKLIGGVAGGIGGFFTGLISGKVLAGIAAGVMLVMGFMLFTTTKQRDSARKTTQDIGNAVAEIAGVDPLKLTTGQIIPTLRVIGTDRDTARRERNNFREASARQGASIITLNIETKRQKLRADEAVRLVTITTRERDVWITRAKLASTRTERMTAEAEIKQTEEVLDALYNAGY